MKKALSYSAMLLFVALLMTVQSCKKKKNDVDAITVTDIDGNVYSTITINGVVWMAENLRTTKYNDGTAITTGLDATGWLNNRTGSYAIYDNVTANNTTYGKLYNWYAVNTGKLAPTGWHVATDAEFATLATNLGGFAVAGGKMKSTSTLWNSPNTGANNSSGFNGLPGGHRSYLGTGYTGIGNAGYWWTSSERNATQGDYSKLDNSFASLFHQGANKTFGYSVRCVKN